MLHRLLSKCLFSLHVGDQHLAVDERAPSFPRRRIAVAFCKQAVFSGPHAMLGGVGALLRGSLTLTADAHHVVGAGPRTGTIVGPLAHFACSLGDCHVARDSDLVSRQRRDIASIGDRVTLLGGPQTRLSAAIAQPGGLCALISAALTDRLADVMPCTVTTGRQVLVAGGLIVIGRDLVAIGARLVSVSAGLIDI